MSNKRMHHLKSQLAQHKSLLSNVLKLAIFGLLAVALYRQLFHREGVHVLWATFQEQIRETNSLAMLLLALVLVPANWILESEKWRLLLGKIEQLSPGAALEAVLSSVTIGFFTPNRVGEFGGRILYLSKGNRWPSVLISLVGSLAQIAATLAVGFASAVWYLELSPKSIYGLQPETLQLLAIVGMVLSVIVYAYHKQLLNGVLKGLLPKRLSTHRKVFNKLNFNDLNIAFWFSIGRHFVFTAQYLLLLRMYGINLAAGEALSALGLIFLAQIVLPTFALFEVVKRSSISVLFLGAFSGNEIGIIAASTSLWIINVVLPALFGYAFIAKKDFGSVAGNRT